MAAVRLSRLQGQILRWLAADEQRTRGMITSSHPELVAALPSAKGNMSHSLRRLETQGLIVMLRTPGGKTRKGLDHRVGHLVSMTTEKTPDLIQRGIATRELPRHPSSSTSHRGGTSVEEVACGNVNPRQAPWQP